MLALMMGHLEMIISNGAKRDSNAVKCRLESLKKLGTLTISLKPSLVFANGPGPESVVLQPSQLQ